LLLVTIGVGLAGVPARAEEPATQAELEEALARIEELEVRLEVAEQRLREAESWRVDGAAPLTGAGREVVVHPDQVVGEAVAFGDSLVVRGRVRGPAVAFGGDVRVHEGAHVEGDAVAFGGQVRVQEGGTVEGDRVAFGPAATGGILPSVLDPGGLGRTLARRLVLLLTLAGAGALAVGLFPGQVDTVARAVEAHPVRSGLVGLGASALALFVAVVLALTLLGIPVALLALALLGLAWILGLLGLCQAVGDRLPMEGVGARRWTAFLGGLVILACFGVLPVVVQLLVGTVGLVGAGAAVQTRLGTRAGE